MSVFVDIVLAGRTPLLMNKFSDLAQISATEGSRSSSAASDRGTPREQAEARLYLGRDTGKPVIPQPNIFRCIMEGGRYFKVGKRQITTQKTSLIAACLDIEELEIPLTYKEPWDIDIRPVRIPATGGRILCYRPAFFEWKLPFSCELDTDILNPKLFREIVDAAGKRIGLGDFRPDTKGPFGKFNVELWNVRAA
jgi:hypothetical protein